MTASPLAPSAAIAWHTGDGFAHPQAAYYDDVCRHLFVACDSYLSKLTADGKPVAPRWVDGLTAPHGMRTFKTTLFVAVSDGLTAIDVPTGTIKSHIPLPGAKSPTGVAIDSAGAVYVSDPAGETIFVVENGTPTVFATGAEFAHPAGLLVIGNQLFVASRGDPEASAPGGVYAINLKTKQRQPISPAPLGHLDGLERDQAFHFLTLDRAAGTVFRVSPRGEATVLLAGVSGAADPAFVPDKRFLVLPRTTTDAVTAFDLSKVKG